MKNLLPIRRRFTPLVISLLFGNLSALAATDSRVPIGIVFPKELIQRSAEPLSFEWEPIPSNAEIDRYDLTLYQYYSSVAPPKILSRATVKPGALPVRSFGDPLPKGIYAWKIEAKDKQGVVLAAGQSRFRVVPDLYRMPKSYELMAGIALDDFTYQTTVAGLTGEVPSSLFGVLATIEYRATERWNFRGTYRNSSMTFGGASLSCSELTIGTRYRKALDREESWHLVSGLDISSLSTPQFTPQADQTFVLSKITRRELIPIVTADYRLSEGASLYASIAFAFGMSLSSSDPLATEGKGGSSLALSTGIRSLIAAPWGFEVETTYMRDGYSYRRSGQDLSTSNRGYKVHLAATRLF